MNAILIISPAAGTTDPSREYRFEWSTHTLSFRGLCLELLDAPDRLTKKPSLLQAELTDGRSVFTAVCAGGERLRIVALTLPEWKAV